MSTILRVYEIQNTGKGVIATLPPENLLKIFDFEEGLQGLQQVLNRDSTLPQISNISVQSSLLTGSNENYLEVWNEDYTDTFTPGISLINEVGATKAGILIYPDKLVAVDSIRSKGLEYPGDYESNFTARSLVTKQFVESKTTGSETKLSQGTNVTITGTGTTASPYVINASGGASAPDATTSAKGIVKLAGDLGGTADSPTTPTALHKTGDETKTGNLTVNAIIKAGGTSSQYLMADGTISTLNPQSVITTSYVLTDADNNSVIFINNAATAITITLNALVTTPNFNVGFIQEGTADVTFVGTGVSLTNPVGLKSKGQGYQTFIERKLSTSTFYLLGNTKA